MTEVFLCQIHSYWDLISFIKFFQAWLFMTLWRVELLWTFLPEEHAHSNQSKCAPINMLHSKALHVTCSGRRSPKKCVFGCKGKITLFSFPKNPVLRKQLMQFVLSWKQQSFANVGFKKRPSSTLDLHMLWYWKMERAQHEKIRHYSELQAVSKTTLNFCVLLAIGAQVLMTLWLSSHCRQKWPKSDFRCFAIRQQSEWLCRISYDF